MQSTCKPTAPNAGGYAPRLFDGMDRGAREGYRRTDFARAMEGLLASGAIVNREYKAGRGVVAWRLEIVVGSGVGQPRSKELFSVCKRCASGSFRKNRPLAGII